MPERVTKEERLISMVIEKAREAKEILYSSLMDNNRSPKDDVSEVYKLKRPKAENAKDLVPKNRKGDGYGLGGQMSNFKKAIVLMKAILEEDYDDNPVFNEERKQEAIENLEATEKELDDLVQMLNEGMNQKDFEQQFSIMLRRLTDMQQMLGEQPKKDTPVPILSRNPNEYR